MTLDEITKDLKSNFETVKDIVLTYQNDIYRQSSDDYDDLKSFISMVDKNIVSLEDVAKRTRPVNNVNDKETRAKRFDFSKESFYKKNFNNNYNQRNRYYQGKNGHA